jgi:crossover junction endodeoxyribonuclease RusA
VTSSRGGHGSSDVLTVTLPMPPSANRIWRNVQGRTLLSKDARAYKEQAGWLVVAAAKAQALRITQHSRFSLTLLLWYGNRRRTDISNRVKLLEDTIADALGFDDTRIDVLHVERAGIDHTSPCVAVTLEVLL